MPALFPQLHPALREATVRAEKRPTPMLPAYAAACSRVGLTCSSAPSEVLYINGNATTVAAMTVAGHEKAIIRPMCSSADPTGLRRPKISSRKNPTTVGGSTSGRVSTPSTHARIDPCNPYIARAAISPRKNVATVAAQVVAIEMMSGDESNGRCTVKQL